MQTILKLFPETQSNATCANHPQRAALQLCDHCNRFLCGDCMDEAINLPARAFYYCYDAACEAAFRQMLKRMLGPTLILIPLGLLFLLSAKWDTGFGFWISIPSLVLDVKLILAYRRRQNRRKQMLAGMPTLQVSERK